jgi:hypothetical protein
MPAIPARGDQAEGGDGEKRAAAGHGHFGDDSPDSERDDWQTLRRQLDCVMRSLRSPRISASKSRNSCATSSGADAGCHSMTNSDDDCWLTGRSVLSTGAVSASLWTIII